MRRNRNKPRQPRPSRRWLPGIALGLLAATGAHAAGTASDVNISRGTADDMCGQAPAYCKPGQTCNLGISIKGKSAGDILAELKKTTKPAREFKDMGLTIYESADSLLRCDATEESAPSCQIYLDVPKRRLTPGVVCE